MRCFVLAVFYVPLAMTVAHGQNQQFEGKIISTVTFEPTEQPLTPSALSAAQSLRPGARFRSQDAASTIDKLFATGRYEDIVVDAQPFGNGVAVKIVSTPQWFIGHVGVQGDVRQSPTPNELIDASRLILGQPFKASDLSVAEVRVRRLLERNGLYDAKVDATEILVILAPRGERQARGSARRKEQRKVKHKAQRKVQRKVWNHRFGESRSANRAGTRRTDSTLS